MSESALAAYRRRIATNDYPLPSDPVVGISKDSSLSSAVLATRSDLMPKLWYPEESPTAIKASNLANKSDSSPKIWRPTLSSDAATAALLSKEHTKIPHHEPSPLSASASKAALQAAETPGEVYGAKYLKDGYEFTARSKEPIGEWAHLAATRITTPSLTQDETKLAEQSGAAALKQGGTNEQLQRMDIKKIEGLARERAQKTLSNVYIDVSRDRLSFKGANAVVGQPADDPKMLDYLGEQQYWQRRDVLSLVSIADRNAKNQLAQINKDVADQNILGSLEAQRKAYALASENHKKRTVHLGKVNVGGGLYMTQEEIDDIARRNVQPTLDEVTEVAAEKREADRIEAERLAEERRVQNEERKAKEDAKRQEYEARERERREQHEARTAANEQLRKERAAAREEKAKQRSEAKRLQQEHKAQLRQEAEERAAARRLDAEDRAATRRLEAEARAKARRDKGAAQSPAPAIAAVSNPISSGAATAATPAVAAPAAAAPSAPAADAINPVSATAASNLATGPSGASPVASGEDSLTAATSQATSPPTRTVSNTAGKTSYTSKGSSMFRRFFDTTVKGVAAGGAAAGAAAGGMTVKPVSLRDDSVKRPEAREKIAKSPKDVPNADTLAEYKLEARRLKIDRQSFEQAAENAKGVHEEALELVETLKNKHAEAAEADKPALAREIEEAQVKVDEAAAADNRAREAALAAISRHRDAKARYHDLSRTLKALEAGSAVNVGETAAASDPPTAAAETAAGVTDKAVVESGATEAAKDAGAAVDAADTSLTPAEATAAVAAAVSNGEGTTATPAIDTKLDINLVGEKLDLQAPKEDKFAGFDSSNVESNEGIFKEDI